MSLDTLAVMMETKDFNEKLLLGLELAFRTLEDEEMARDILFLIGIVPNGLFYQDLTKMLETDIEDDLQILEKTCLVEKNVDKKSQQIKYSISPFVEDFVETKMSEKSRKRSLNLLACYFRSEVQEVLLESTY